MHTKSDNYIQKALIVDNIFFHWWFESIAVMLTFIFSNLFMKYSYSVQNIWNIFETAKHTKRHEEGKQLRTICMPLGEQKILVKLRRWIYISFKNSFRAFQFKRS